MKLFLDQNLSRRMLPLLQDRFPGSTQAWVAGMDRAPDLKIWNYAKREGFVIVTQDGDFQEMSLLRGWPPAVIWLRTGNIHWKSLAELLLGVDPILLQSLECGDVSWIEIS
ncbi:MAG: DUF5615 family PIN-like protein [Magnetococcales bacterium]|nr:DUF5615 family PIN-like protein [Magnetococcales bacterium]